MKILFKITGVLLLLVIIVFGIFYIVYNEPIPKGNSGPAADALAEKMLKAINYETYKNTRYLEWSFAKGAHQYKWDKAKGVVEVKWDDYVANINLSQSYEGSVTNNKSDVSPKEIKDASEKAIEYFNNDSFWLVAPFKVFDKGTKRSIVSLEDGSEALLVEYTSGGTTPGDSYLWKLLPNGFPESYQMWVKIIPIGGLEASWDDWKIMENGLALPATHKLGPITLDMGDVRAYN